MEKIPAGARRLWPLIWGSAERSSREVSVGKSILAWTSLSRKASGQRKLIGGPGFAEAELEERLNATEIRSFSAMARACCAKRCPHAGMNGAAGPDSVGVEASFGAKNNSGGMTHGMPIDLIGIGNGIQK